MKRKRLGLLLLLSFLVLFVVVFTGIVALHSPSTEQMKANAQSQIPIGSRRPKVEAFIKAHRIDQAAFDYPSTDPRQGTLIVGQIDPPPLIRQAQDLFPSLTIPTVHIVFHFDRKGPNGKLTQYQVSDRPIPAPPP